MSAQTAETETAAPEQEYGTWRRARDGEWVVMAPHAYFVKAEKLWNSTVDVRAKGGKRRVVRIGRYGSPFDVNGVPMAYGHTTDYGTCDDCGRKGRLEYIASDYSSGLSGFACYECAPMACFG